MTFDPYKPKQPLSECADRIVSQYPLAAVHFGRHTSEDTKRLVERVWRCDAGKHKNCFASSHLSIEEVIAEAEKCAISCHCWRHAVIEYTYS